MQKLIWQQIYFAVVFIFILKSTLQLFMSLSKGSHVLLSPRLLSSQFWLDLLLSHFYFFISYDMLFFLILYLVSSVNFFECNHLNWAWRSKQFSVTTELFLFPLCCVVGVLLFRLSFFFVSPMYSALKLQFNV